MTADAPQRFAAMSTPSLWAQHSVTAAPLDLAFIEAELGARGETASGGDYLGRKTASAYRRSLYSRGAVTGSGRDCSDFPSSAAAQKFFLANGGPLSDPYNLDGDGDGLACEWGTRLNRVSSSHRVAYTPRRSGRCYVGPRGGTYTITASNAGPDPATATVTDESFDPSVVQHLEVRYLGIRTRDQVGNLSDWEQKFVFRYDKTIPKNPSSATEENGAESGVWQNSVSDPSFVWSGSGGGEGAEVGDGGVGA